MKPVETRGCRVHILVCVNEREAAETSCHQVGGNEFYRRLKEKVSRSGLTSSHWITRTHCLGFCNKVGTTLTIHARDLPARWFSEVTEADFDFIWGEIMRQ